MIPLIKKVAAEYKQSLVALYGDELSEVILFGSYARGDNHSESDIDFAVVLERSDMRPSAEIIKISPVSSRLSLKHGIMISSLPVSKDKMEHSMQWVYQAIRKEGIRI